MPGENDESGKVYVLLQLWRIASSPPGHPQALSSPSQMSLPACKTLFLQDHALSVKGSDNGLIRQRNSYKFLD